MFRFCVKDSVSVVVEKCIKAVLHMYAKKNVVSEECNDLLQPT